jgi:HEAT repeat protein
MLHIVRTEPDPEIRQNAVFWIGQFDDPRAAEALVEIINQR